MRALRPGDGRLAGRMKDLPIAAYDDEGCCLLCGRWFLGGVLVQVLWSWEPVCRVCLESANRNRARLGIPRIVIRPGGRVGKTSVM